MPNITKAGSNSVNCYQQQTIDNYVVNSVPPTLGAPTAQLLNDQALSERMEDSGSLCNRNSHVKRNRDTGVVLEL